MRRELDFFECGSVVEGQTVSLCRSGNDHRFVATWVAGLVSCKTFSRSFDYKDTGSWKDALRQVHGAAWAKYIHYQDKKGVWANVCLGIVAAETSFSWMSLRATFFWWHQSGYRLRPDQIQKGGVLSPTLLANLQQDVTKLPPRKNYLKPKKGR